jgi:type I restriction enzyme S subunit
MVGKDPLPYLRNINVRWDRVDTDDLLMMDFTDREREEFRLQVGDVLVCEGGEPGRAAVWEDQAPGALFQKALHRVRVDRERLLPKYLVIHLWADALAGRLDRYFTGSTIKHFTGVQLKKYEIRFPQLEIQECIVNEVQSKLSVMEVLERQIDAELARSAALGKAVLGRAFTGRLLTREAA